MKNNEVGQKKHKGNYIKTKMKLYERPINNGINTDQ